MQFVFNAIIGFLALIPVMTLLDGPTVRAAASGIILLTLALSAICSDDADIAHAARVTRGLRVLAAVPVCWCLFQLVPLPFAFSNSIWESAAVAVGQISHGHITVDIGYTAVATMVYLASVGLVLNLIFVAKDRDHAEILLYCLGVITTVTVIGLGYFQLNPASALAKSVTFSRAALAGAASQGVVLCFAACLRTVERHKSWNSKKRLLASSFALLLVCLGCLAVCLIAVGVMTSADVAIATSFGCAVLCLEVLIRRARLATWSSLTLGATLLVSLGMIAAWRINSGTSSSILLRVAQVSAETTVTLQRMIADAPWAGDGIGCFPAVWQIYHSLTETSTVLAPTTAISIMIEGGAILFLFVLFGSGSLFYVLLRRALSRGRDSVYPTVAAAAIAVALLEAFIDASFFSTGVNVIVIASIGLGLAQSVSQAKGEIGGLR